jgi:hypothetical protein
LLSIGINRNDDVFIPEEILPVRNTGAHKPLNIEHDPNQIVGHMLRTFAALKDGTMIPDKKIPKEKNFDIIAEAVLYKFLFAGLAQQIEEQARANELFVSVEVWFTAFDFLVGDKIVKRNAQTASVLDRHLKANGGSGEFEGNRLGRVLRNMIIGGIGLVKVPANPKSVIKSISSLNSQYVQEIEDKLILEHIEGDIFELSENSLTVREEIMKKELLEEYAQILAAQRAAETEVIEKTEDNVPEKEAPQEVSFEVKQLMARLNTVEESNKELREKFAESELRAEATERVNVLKNIGLGEDTVEKAMSRLIFMNREDFEEYVDFLVTALADLTKTNASVEADNDIDSDTDKTDEGGDGANAAEQATNEDVVDDKIEEVTTPEASEDVSVEVAEKDIELEATDTQEDVSAEVETEAPATDSQENVEEEAIDLENIEPIDTELKLETDTSVEPTLAEKMADVAQRFLVQRNPDWEKLAIKK